MSQRYDYDLFVIGGGSGGVRAARIAAGHGARVAIAEEYRYGGTCVIRGCVPKKLLVYASRFHGELEDARGFGWTVDGARFDWRTLIANKDKEIARLEAAYLRNLETKGVTAIRSRATIEGPNAVRLADGNRRVTAERILVATGAAPVIPDDIPYDGGRLAEAKGLAGRVISSNEAFHLASLPKSIVIVGGAYIAVEFATIFNGLGSRVTLLYRGEQILRGFDQDLRDDLAAALAARGIDLRVRSTPMAVESTKGGVRVKLAAGAPAEAELVMFATGRRPNTAGLGLETAGVTTGPVSEIVVDPQSQTSVPSIFAIGDVTNRFNLTPVAIREGHAFADSTYGGKPWRTSYEMIPTAVFAEPEVGTVGLPEHQAAKRGPLDIYKARFRPMKFTLSGREERMLMKLVVDRASGRVLGCHVLGPDAGEIVQMAAIAMRMGATKDDFDRTMALHPSAAEELVTMRDKWVPPAKPV